MRWPRIFLSLLFPVLTGASAVRAQDNSVQKPYSLQRAVDYIAVDPFGFQPKLGNRGLLIAYTETEEYNDGQTRYYPHTEYRILDLNGKLLKKVRNRVSRNDENPTPIALSPGFYLLETPWKKSLVQLKTGCVTTARLYSSK